MKSLFLYCCFVDDLNNLPEDIEYLFINTLAMDNIDEFIKPNINYTFKLMYVHRVRVNSHYYVANINISLPFNSRYMYNKHTYLCYNFEMRKEEIFNIIENIFNDSIDDIFNNGSYWFNIHEKGDRFDYKYQNFNTSLCIFNNTFKSENENTDIIKWICCNGKIKKYYSNEGKIVSLGE